MAESAVALRYAEALYALAREKGRTDEVLRDLAGLKAALDAEASAWSKVLDPRIETELKEEFLNGPLAGRDVLVVNLLKLVLRRRREGILRDFFRIYLEVHEQREGVVRVIVEAATSLDASVQENLRSRLEAATGKDVVLEVREDPTLLGGLRFIIGSQLIDGSVRSRLERVARGLRTVPLH